MSSDDAVLARAGDGPLSNPWPVLVTSLALTATGFLWSQVLSETAVLPRIGVLLIGLLAAGAAVAICPRPRVIALAGAAAVLACFGMNPAWDSVRLLLAVLAGVAFAASLVLLLPRWGRRLAFSLFILFHFGGILTAVTSVAPSPWLSNFLWTRFYRRYLEFMYLNNAYHFYSPNPGPATLAWFRVQYEDGTARWVKVPNRVDYPLAICYQRRLSLTESINQLAPPVQRFPEQNKFRRQRAGEIQGVPMHPELTDALQWRFPSTYSRRMLESYARFAARHFPHLKDPDQQVSTIKIYRVIHNIPNPQELALTKGRFDDEALYLPFYQGEYTPDGKLINPSDPFLFWLIPILKVPKAGPITGFGVPNAPLGPNDFEVKDYLSIHAGDKASR